MTTNSEISPRIIYCIRPIVSLGRIFQKIESVGSLTGKYASSNNSTFVVAYRFKLARWGILHVIHRQSSEGIRGNWQFIQRGKMNVPKVFVVLFILRVIHRLTPMLMGKLRSSLSLIELFVRYLLFLIFLVSQG